jgi:hypothetical protein
MPDIVEEYNDVRGIREATSVIGVSVYIEEDCGVV